MPTYDAKILETMADRLYSAARWIVLRYAFLGGCVGGVAGLGALAYLDSVAALPVVVVVGALGAALGATVAQERAFQLRLQAQQILVSVAIERNTRPA